MEEWHCFKCKVKMEQTQITLNYMEFDSMIEGLKCPKCGSSYVTEEMAAGELREGEKNLEGK